MLFENIFEKRFNDYYKAKKTWVGGVLVVIFNNFLVHNCYSINITYIFSPYLEENLSLFGWDYSYVRLVVHQQSLSRGIKHWTVQGNQGNQ